VPVKYRMAAADLRLDAYVTDEERLYRVNAFQGQWVVLEDCGEPGDNGLPLLKNVSRCEVLRTFRVLTPDPC